MNKKELSRLVFTARLAQEYRFTPEAVGNAAAELIKLNHILAESISESTGILDLPHFLDGEYETQWSATMVNAQQHFMQIGIVIEEATDEEHRGTIYVKLPSGERLALPG